MMNNDKELDIIIESLVKEAKDSRNEDVENDISGYFDDFVMDWAGSVGLAITQEKYDKDNKNKINATERSCFL